MIGVRVYALARELGIKSSDLLKKLEEIGIPATSSSNTLSKSEVKKVREKLEGGERKIIEERVKPGIIRRRAKKVSPPAPEVKEEGLPEKEAVLEDKAGEKAAPPKVEVVGKPVKKVKKEEVAVEDKKPGVIKLDRVKEEEKEKEKEKGKGKVSRRKRADRRGTRRRTEIIREKEQYVKTFRGMKRGRGVGKKGLKKTRITTPKALKRKIKINEAITVSELSKKMGAKASVVIKKLIDLGLMVTINQAIDLDTAALIAEEFGYAVENIAFEEEGILKDEDKDIPGEVVPRPPVVTIMGHVDHGKTTFLDAIRESRITEGEDGGITQHIGAYEVELSKGKIVFLDTPGHEAFTSMRARGAMITDIVVLVVAADDGVMPQTIEAIEHAKAGGVQIVVAINKIDKPGVNPQNIKQGLSEHGLVPEDWGGDTLYGMISAKYKTGIEEFLEQILLQADLIELKANPEKAGKGVVIEANLDKGLGPVSTILIQDGSVRVGDYVVCGTNYGKIKAMINDKGERVEYGGPSQPRKILGLSGVPMAGEDFNVVSSEEDAKRISHHRYIKRRESEILKTSKVSLEDLFSRIESGETKELGVIIKGDVQGSVEVIKESLEKIGTDEVKIKIIRCGVGGITEGDVMLASASNAIVLGFRVRPESKASFLAEMERVDIKLFNVIYDLIEEFKKALVGMLEPAYEEKSLGRAEVKDIFKIRKVGTIAGCYIRDGLITRSARVRLIRDSTVIYEGKIASLKRFKDDVREVANGLECGISVEGYNDIKAGDMVEAYMIEEVARTL